MKLCISILAVAAFLGSPAVADQVIASPGVTLTEAAQVKFNRDTRAGDRHVKPVPGNAEPSAQLYRAAGLSPEEAQGWTLEQLFVAKINRESSGDGQQRLPPASVSRAYGMGSDYSALARSAGLTPDEAANMSFDEIANAKLNREH